MVETFFKTLKAELVWRTESTDRRACSGIGPITFLSRQ